MANWFTTPRHMKFYAMQYANGVSLFDPIAISGDEGYEFNSHRPNIGTSAEIPHLCGREPNRLTPLWGVFATRHPKSDFWGS